MKIKIISIGNKLDKWLRDGIKNYEKKLPSFVKFEWLEIKPEKNFSTIDKKKKQEAITIKSYIKESIYICLDENGNSFSSLNSVMKDKTPIGDLKRKCPQAEREGKILNRKKIELTTSVIDI